MTDTSPEKVTASENRPKGLTGLVEDWSSDQRAFKNVSWRKAMMWIFLLSDTFIFSILGKKMKHIYCRKKTTPC